jgi:hypothetical protein
LPIDHLGLGVHAFGPAVVKRQGDGRDHGSGVQVQPAGEGVQVREVASAGACAARVLGGLLAGGDDFGVSG